MSLYVALPMRARNVTTTLPVLFIFGLNLTISVVFSHYRLLANQSSLMLFANTFVSHTVLTRLQHCMTFGEAMKINSCRMHLTTNIEFYFEPTYYTIKTINRGLTYYLTTLTSRQNSLLTDPIQH